MCLIKHLVITCLLINIIFAAQWPVGVDTFNTVNSNGFTYSGVTNLQLTNGFTAGDSSAIYTVASWMMSGTAHSMIFRMNHTFDIEWNRWLQGAIDHEAMKVTSDNANIVISLTSCVAMKLSTTDGSILLQK